MKKFAWALWDANEKVLIKIYTRQLRPVFDYSIAVWSTSAKSKVNKINKIQNKGIRIGGIKTTPVNERETNNISAINNDRKRLQCLANKHNNVESWQTTPCINSFMVME